MCRNPMTTNILTDSAFEPFPPYGRNCPAARADRFDPIESLGVRQKPTGYRRRFMRPHSLD
jgi:hypothetical protein